MKLVYFTTGEALKDRRVREQVLRIPEVLSEVKKVKKACADNVQAFLNLKGGLEEWVAIVQKGLFLRLKNTGFKYSGLVKRGRWPQEDQLEGVLLPILQAKQEIEIFVIGPGFDDLHMHIRKIQKKYRLSCEVVFCEIIHNDRRLQWFWPELVEIQDERFADAPLH